MTKILFASSEVAPLVKTGGLGDVSASLPAALAGRGHDIRVIMPAYRAVKEHLTAPAIRAELSVPGQPQPLRLLEGALPSGVAAYFVDAPWLFNRPGGPYVNEAGHDWPDNAERFGAFCRACVAVALNRAGLGWEPAVVHAHDWQSGLIPVLLAQEDTRPGTVFTIHNLAYQGIFGWPEFQSLALPRALWSPAGLEFFGNFSFIKGGIAFADRITTVSPTYAREIQTAALGHGLEGLLQYRSDRLHGILNGVDYTLWDPQNDAHLPARYGPDSLKQKNKNKAALQARLGLEPDADAPVLGMIGRLTYQKGFDLLVAALDRLMEEPIQIALLGAGDADIEQSLRDAAERWPGRVGLMIGFDEPLAHLIEAGADLFLMPSRFEPCGLNQIYSLRYGTPPVVRRTGGLADTVVDATETNLKAETATGFQFEAADAQALYKVVRRAMDLYARPRTWRALQQTGMAQDFSWDRSAGQYLALYEEATTSE